MFDKNNPFQSAGHYPCIGWRILLPLAIAALGILPAFAQKSIPAASSAIRFRFGHALPFVGLTVLPAPRVQQVAPNLGDFGFGHANALDTPRVERLFTLRNDGKTPITLARVEPSMTVSQSSGRKSDNPRAPGAILLLHHRDC